MNFLFAIFISCILLQVSNAWDHLSFDSDNFICDNYDKFCENILNEVGCHQDNTSRIVHGCNNNNVYDWIGTCSCSSPIVINNSGKRTSQQLITNRISSVIGWNLEPWKEGPPYDLPSSFNAICDLLMERINCPAEYIENVSSNYKVVNGVKVPDFSCNCGTYKDGGDVILNMIYDKFNEYNTKSTPVFADPVYLSVPLSLAITLIVGKLGAILAIYLKFPAIVGFLLTGLGIQNILNPMVLKGAGFPYPSPASELKTFALIIIIMRAGLSVKIEELINNWKMTSMLCIIPYFCEFITWLYIGKDMYGWEEVEMGLFASIMAPLGPSLVISACFNLLANKKKDHGYPIKQVLIASPIESVIAIVLFGIFSNLNQTSRNTMYPWVDPLPLWLNCLLIPINLIFSMVLGFIIGWCSYRYIRWRSHLKTDYIWRKVDKNPHMGSSTGDFIFIFLVLCYTIMALATNQYIQQCSGVLSVYSAAVTLSIFLEDSKAYKIADGLKGIWTFAEVFLFTLTGTQLSFDSSNGPLYGQRGLDPNGIAKVISMLVIGFCFRYFGIVIVLLCLFITFPKHRQNFKWVALFSICLWILQMPKATVQATLGSNAYNQRIIPGEDGLKKGLLISQCTAFAILIFAPIGCILVQSVASPLACYLTKLDKEAGWDPALFYYKEDSPYYDPVKYPVPDFKQIEVDEQQRIDQEKKIEEEERNNLRDQESIFDIILHSEEAEDDTDNNSTKDSNEIAKNNNINNQV